MASVAPDGERPASAFRVVSGGQTGVDRAAADVAQALAIDCGGWCPRGRRAEDGTIPDHYPLRETQSADYAERSRLNVRDSDATLVLTHGNPIGGTALTVEYARTIGRPTLIIDPAETDARTLVRVRHWMAEHGVGVLNVAGPRESTIPGIGRAAASFLDALLR